MGVGRRSHAPWILIFSVNLFFYSNSAHFDEFSSFLRLNEVRFICQDVNYHVPNGLTAALLMHVEYRVMHPDHVWVGDDQRKLIQFMQEFTLNVID